MELQITYWDFLLSDKDPAPLWQGYTPDMTDEEATLAFAKKYGYNPEELLRYDSCILIGPVVE